MHFSFLHSAVLSGSAALLMFAGVSSADGATIYLEDFTGQVGKGYTGPDSGPTLDLAGVDWTIDVTDGEYSATSDYFRVVDNGGDAVMRFLDNDADGNGDDHDEWISPVIDISSYTDVAISMDVAATGGYLAPRDMFTLNYRIDGGPLVEFFAADFSDGTGFPEQNVSSGTLAPGSSLQIFVHGSSISSTRPLEFDDVTVTGVPEPASLALLSAGGLLMLSRRRR
ncbi:MAG: PEP-CTERM sorting domain-containing protein [Phycisphaeraceae bacterium]